MNRTKSIAAAALLLGSTAWAATAPATGTAKVAKAAKAAPKKAAAATTGATTAAAALTPGQLDAAARVHTGEAACEFDEKVRVAPIDGRPGHFKLAYRKASYTVVPEETTTGAVRLEDRKAGIVWLQIPAKSMLMSSRIGQRIADNCLHAEQRVASAAPAGNGIGIAADKP